MGAREQKVRRMRDASAHREGDGVPSGEFFWTGFLNQYRCRFGAAFDPYRHFDLDYVLITPNMDPRIRPFEVLRQSASDIVVRTGFGATIRREVRYKLQAARGGGWVFQSDHSVSSSVIPESHELALRTLPE